MADLVKPTVAVKLIEVGICEIIVRMNTGDRFVVRAAVRSTLLDGTELEQPIVDIDFHYPDGTVIGHESLGSIRHKTT